ncbi:glycosyltransferase [Anseongella ginsenosidimutans]|uniref:glycosyltransferase n=1 Tax=Anseongella ginsenosidimutans TaxID=496056 RepID=UPI0014055606|nr:glycosyltransferase [Anseongella ginsenosidimutans]
MRIVHVNAYDGNGGAGRAMMRLHHALKHTGAQSDALCMYQFDPHSDVTPIYRNWWGKLRSIATIFGERYLGKALAPSRGIPFSLQKMGLPVHRHPLVLNADIIHLHWVNHGMLAPRQMKKLLELGKPLVWSLHDCNPFTGGCHVRYDCRRYEISCGTCPALNSRSSNDWSHRTWNAKAKAYGRGRITWVAPSSWMGESVRKASLARGNEVAVIGNALETNVFHPGDRHSARQQLGISQDAFVLLAGHMPSSTDRHKGGAELIQAIRRFRELPGVDHAKILLVFFGGKDRDEADSWPYPAHFAGKIGQEEKLAGYYQAADVFLFPSLQESMGYTALESLACGTPVVAFRTSGVTDVVLHEENGYLATLGDTDQFAEGISWIYHHPSRGELASRGVAHATGHFESGLIAEKHLALYKRLLKAD